MLGKGRLRSISVDSISRIRKSLLIKKILSPRVKDVYTKCTMWFSVETTSGESIKDCTAILEVKQLRRIAPDRG